MAQRSPTGSHCRLDFFSFSSLNNHFVLLFQAVAVQLYKEFFLSLVPDHKIRLFNIKVGIRSQLVEILYHCTENTTAHVHVIFVMSYLTLHLDFRSMEVFKLKR